MYSSGVMILLIVVTSSKITFMVKESTNGLTAESTTVNGLTTKWKVKVSSPGLTEESMSENIRTIKNTALVPSNGQMVVSTLENGKKVSNTERVNTSKKAKAEEASGRWVRESSGSKKTKNDLVIFS